MYSHLTYKKHYSTYNTRLLLTPISPVLSSSRCNYLPLGLLGCSYSEMVLQYNGTTLWKQESQSKEIQIKFRKKNTFFILTWLGLPVKGQYWKQDFLLVSFSFLWLYWCCSSLVFNQSEHVYKYDIFFTFDRLLWEHRCRKLLKPWKQLEINLFFLLWNSLLVKKIPTNPFWVNFGLRSNQFIFIKHKKPKEATHSFVGLGEYLPFEIKISHRRWELRFSWYYTTFRHVTKVYFCLFQRNSCHCSNGNGQPSF